MKTISTRNGRFPERPHFENSEIDRICVSELKKVGLYPNSPEPIRIDRFIEKRFGVTPEYKSVPDGVLGYTAFNSNGVAEIVISAALDDGSNVIAERRVRTTMAHEAGHGLLHAHLFVLGAKPANMFDADSYYDNRILCRGVAGEGQKSRGYDGRWWEYQANRAIGGLLCPCRLTQEVLKPYLIPCGELGLANIDPQSREAAVRALADVFNVNPVVVRIRIDDLYPAENGQFSL
jgi:hypothetical protein